MREGIGRVPKIGGRALAVDFGRGSGRGLLAHFHRHGYVDLTDMVTLLGDVGLTVTEKGPVGMNNLHFVLVQNSGNPVGPERKGA